VKVLAEQGKRGSEQGTVVSAGGDLLDSSRSAGETSTQPKYEAPAAGGVAATLIGVDGDLQGQVYVLSRGENRLGRGADCSPLLDSRWISRLHAHVTFEQGRLLLRASEGKDVFVNDVLSNEENLQDGDRIRLGTTTFLLRTVTGGEQPSSSVVPVKPRASAAQRMSAGPSARPEALPAAVAPAGKRKRSFWRFWEKSTPSLVFVRGARAGERVQLGKPRIRIGGLGDNDIVVAGHDASRNHAELRVRGGRVHVWDLRSVNGTWVNERRIENVELQSGDVIRIGSEELRYED